MSHDLVNAAYRVDGLSLAEKAVLVSLADQADGKAYCFPGIELTANRISADEKTVRRALPRLEAAGHITIAAAGTFCPQHKGRGFDYHVHPQSGQRVRIESGQRVRLPHSADADILSTMVGTESGQSGQGVRIERAESPANHHESSLNRQEPSEVRSAPSTSSTKPRKASKPRKPELALQAYLDDCAARGVDPVPHDAPVFQLAADKKIPDDFVDLAWAEFRRHRVTGGRYAKKKQADWAATFRNAVDGNWDRLWWCRPDGSFELTSAGREALNLHSRMAA